MVEQSHIFRQKDSLQSPDSRLFQKVLGKIERCVWQSDEFGQLGFGGEGTKLEPKNILLPPVGIDDSDRLETSRVLQVVGLSSELPVIFLPEKQRNQRGAHGLLLQDIKRTRINFPKILLY